MPVSLSMIILIICVRTGIYTTTVGAGISVSGASDA